VSLLSLSPHEGAEQKTLISGLREKSDIIVTNGTQVVESSTALIIMLQSFPPGINPTGLAVVLSLQAEVLPQTAFVSFFSICKQFLMNSTAEDLKFVKEEITSISHKLVSISCQIGQPRAAINMIKQIIPLYGVADTCLTPAHADLLQACIAGQMYSYAVDFLRCLDIFEINSTDTNLKCEDFLKFFYYSGICYIAVKDYEAALASFDQCISAPANALSHIVICALKKAKLVSLISPGRALIISSGTSSTVSRYCKTKMPVYDPIVAASTANKREDLLRAIAEGQETLLADGNWGIAKQVLEAATKHCIARLSKTFLTLPLAGVAARADLAHAATTSSSGSGSGIPSSSISGSGSSASISNSTSGEADSMDAQLRAERCLLKLINDGKICAKINSVTGMVTFEELGSTVGADNNYNSSSGNQPSATAAGGGSDVVLSIEAAAQMERYLEDTMALSNKLRDLRTRVLTSANYVMKTTAKAKGVAGMGVADLDSMNPHGGDVMEF